MPRKIIKENKSAEVFGKNDRILRLFLDSASETFTILDSKLNIIYQNKSAMRLFHPREKKEDIIGRNLLEVVPNLKKTGRYGQFMNVMKTGKSFSMEDVVTDPKFGSMHLSLEAFKVGNGLGVITSDITEQKRIERELKLFQKFIDSSNQALGIADQDKNIIYANRTLNRILEEKDAVGNNVMRYYRKNDLPELKKILKKVSKKGNFSFEMPLVSAKGKVIQVIQNLFLIEGNGEPVRFANVIIDITKRKKIEDILKDKLQEVERINRLMVGRELKMIDLKKQIIKLKSKLK